MAYLQSIQAQSGVFLRTVGFGFLLGVLYDLLRLVRLLCASRRIVPWDVGFGAFAGVAAFLFALTQNGGQLRLHLLCALGVGFCVWVFLAGQPLRAATDRILHTVRRVVFSIRRPIDRLSACLVSARESLIAYGKKVIKSSKKNRKPS